MHPVNLEPSLHNSVRSSGCASATSLHGVVAHHSISTRPYAHMQRWHPFPALPPPRPPSRLPLTFTESSYASAPLCLPATQHPHANGVFHKVHGGLLHQPVRMHVPRLLLHLPDSAQSPPTGHVHGSRLRGTGVGGVRGGSGRGGEWHFECREGFKGG